MQPTTTTSTAPQTRTSNSDVLGGSVVSRVTIEVAVVGSNLRRDSFLLLIIDGPKVSYIKCANASGRNSMHIGEHKKLESQNAERYKHAQ